MSTLQNDILLERLAEAFELVFIEDSALRGELAYIYLEGTEYYLFCKDDAQDYLNDYEEDIYNKIEETFINCEGSCFDIRALAEKAFNIEIK